MARHAVQTITGIELALQEQSRQPKSKSFPYTEGGSSGSGSLSYKDVKNLQCGACLRNRPKTYATHTRVKGNCRHPWKDMRVWHECAACRGHKAQNDPSHSKIENECRFADAHVNQRNAASNTKDLSLLWLVLLKPTVMNMELRDQFTLNQFYIRIQVKSWLRNRKCL